MVSLKFGICKNYGHEVVFSAVNGNTIYRMYAYSNLSIGDYRAIYQIKNSELIVVVIKIGHKKNVN